MEWLGVLLLYLISGFMKKRQQNKNRKIIESDPDWDNEDYLEPGEPSNNFSNNSSEITPSFCMVWRDLSNGAPWVKNNHRKLNKQWKNGSDIFRSAAWAETL